MTQDEQKEREAFEAWLANKDPRPFNPNAYDDQEYKWIGWQARAESARTKPVSLGACADAMERAFEDMGFDPPEKSKVVWHKNVTAMATKAVLDAAGVKYVD